MSRDFKAKYAYNFIGAAVPVVSSLVTVPLYISTIGASRYGVVAITWLLLGYFGFLDFGISRASANALSQNGQAGTKERSAVLVTSFYLNLGMGLVASAIFYTGGRFLLLYVFKIPDQFQTELTAAFPWMVAMLPLGMIYSVATGALDSRERFLTSSILGSFGTVAGQILPLLGAIYISPTLTVVIPATALARVLSLMIVYAVTLRYEWPIRSFSIQTAWIKRLFGFGAWVSISSLVTPLLETLDQTVIGGMLGATSVAYYFVPMNLASRSQIVVTALARTLFPRLSRVGPEEARSLVKFAVVTLSYGFGAICGPAILLAGPFLRAWVGDTVGGASQPVAEILLLGAWLNGLALLPYTLLQGQRRPDLTAKVHLLEIVPFIVLLWGLIRLAGLPGAAIAWTLRAGSEFFVLAFLARCFSRDTIRLIPAFAMMLGCVVIAKCCNLPFIVLIGIATAAPVAFISVGFLMHAPALNFRLQPVSFEIDDKIL